MSAIVDGERVVAREFQTGERLAFEFGRSVVLTAGDAAALAVTINGEEARPLGSAGQVVTVRVTPTNFNEYPNPVSRRTPLLDLFKRGEVPRDVRLQAAEGALPHRTRADPDPVDACRRC